jgi:hypothetical protein
MRKLTPIPKLPIEDENGRGLPGKSDIALDRSR